MNRWLKEKKILFTVAFCFLGLILILKSLPSSSEPEKPAEEAWNVDTVIPEDHVLIPIQVQNIETVGSLVGPAGVVDLWAAHPETGRKSKKIATQVKMIRAPLNPSVFAVLVHESESRQILDEGDTFYVTVHHPSKKESQVVRRPGPRIQFEKFED